MLFIYVICATAISSYHAAVSAMQVSVPRSTAQRFLILCVDQLTNTPMQGILGIGMAELALAGNTQYGHAGLIAVVAGAGAGASDLSVSQTLIIKTHQYKAQIHT